MFDRRRDKYQGRANSVLLSLLLTMDNLLAVWKQNLVLAKLSFSWQTSEDLKLLPIGA